MIPLGNQFKFWCQKVLPLVYDESLSYYEVLCKLADYMNKMFETQESFAESLKELNIRQNTIESEFAELKETVTAQLDYVTEELEKVKNGDYVSLYLDSIQGWIDNNLQSLVGGIVKYVSFGLSNDGYFLAYIPATWDFIKFSTINDPESKLNGHLVLEW